MGAGLRRLAEAPVAHRGPVNRLRSHLDRPAEPLLAPRIYGYLLLTRLTMAIHPDAGALPDTPRNRGDATAPHLSPATPTEDQRTILLNEIAWGAVLAGVVVA